MATFRIPKQADRSLLEALFKIRADIASYKAEHNVRIRAYDGHGSPQLDVPNIEDPPKIVKDILDEDSEIISTFQLRGPDGHSGLTIARKGQEITDEVQIAQDQNWFNGLGMDEEAKRSLIVRLIGSTRKHLRAINTDAGLMGTADSEWARYRSSQNAILNSLQETQ